MEQREKLIELIIESVNGCARHWAEVIADHLLANGVVVLPCRCRDCEHARKLKDNFYGWDFSCKHFNSRWVRSNDFCSYGERKDEVSEC